MGSTGGGRGQGLALPVILLVLGFLVSAAVVQERAQEADLPEQAEGIVDLVRRRQATIRELAGEVRSLTDELTAAQERGAAGTERVSDLVTRVRRMRVPAGLEALRGPGIVVELADSPDAPRTRGEVTDLRIQDVDLQLVVNALWAGGAEAVAINGHRLSGSTPIRRAGDAILVDFQALSSPYRVAAIGDPEALRRRIFVSEIARQMGAWTQIYGLEFSVGPRTSVTVPATSSEPDPAWARPAEGG